MREANKLFRSKNAFDPASDGLFAEAMRENCRRQYERCGEYRRILDSEGFSPEDIGSYDDLFRLPFLPTALFKRRRLSSVKRGLIRATSSGTSGGNVSEIPFCAGDLIRAFRMVLRVSKLRGLFSLRPCHYVIFGYKPHRTNRTAVTKTAFGATLFAPALSRTYALEYRDGKYRVDLERILDRVVRLSRGRRPVRFMGFPSYTYFLMRMMEQRGISVTLPPHSKILLGGGWKQFYTEQTDKEEFYALARCTLGIDDRDIIEFFGAVEHPVLYCDCECHNFHVPTYSRVIIRDARTLDPLPRGSVGLVELLTPISAGAPILSVMTDDLGVLHGADECGCAIATPFLEIVGRVGLRDVRTCAAGAAKLLSEVEL